MKLHELASHLGATLHGDGSIEITGIAGIEQATATQLSFVANPKYASLARTTAAGALLVEPDFTDLPNTAMLRIRDPYLAFSKAIELFYQPPQYPAGIHSTAVIDPTAHIGERAYIGAYVVIGPGAVIGDDATLLPHVVLYQNVRIGHRFFAHAHSVVRESCILGDDVILQNGAIIGCDGFGFSKDEQGRWRKILQSGPAILEDRVEVQSNACIDRASVGETRVHSGAKIDNLVQVGHGSTVGQETLLCSQVGLAGSSIIGKNVILAGQVGVAGHCTIGDGAIATAQTGIPNDVAPGKVVSGYPAIDNRQWLRSAALFNKLPELIRELRSSQRKSS